MRKKISLAPAPPKEKRFEDLNPIELLNTGQKGQFGNRPDYYIKRGTDMDRVDPRVLALDSRHFEGKNVLDVGCHEGIVTLQVAKYYHPRHIKGIDIDYTLVNQAVKHWAIEERMTEIEKERKGAQSSELNQKIEGLKQFPQAIREGDKEVKTLLGKRTSSTDMDVETLVEYPHNVSFEISNILNLDEKREAKKYDSVICFSLTKWIHLNYGDEGIKKMFNKIKTALAPGGILILETQKFKSYNKKTREFKRFGQIYPQITLTPENFETYLVEELGFKKEEVVPSKNTEAFKRDILIYRLT